MRTRLLVRRNLFHFWRTNLAVLAGVATAVAVLSGALLVGESVRASLRNLVLSRLGKTDSVLSAPHFFREALSGALAGSCPLIVVDGFVTHEPSGRRASQITVFGVDDRFFQFHGLGGNAPANRDILLTPSLLRELDAHLGDTILLRVRQPSDIPIESLHGRKDDMGRTLRLNFRGLAAEFELRPQQGDVRAVFLSLRRLQRELKQERKANTILLSAPAQWKSAYTLEDLGVKIRSLDRQNCLSVETSSAIVSDSLARTVVSVAERRQARATPFLSYLVNRMQVGTTSVPYSLVTAAEGYPDGVTLNDWAAHDLKARVGDAITLEYYVWQEQGRLVTQKTEMRVAAIVPIRGAAADRDLTPEYPGITEARSIHDWDPPFPMDLSRIRPRDEQYWDRYRTTPKAFIPLGTGQKLWGTRYGNLTSLRVCPPPPGFAGDLRSAIDPAQMGLAVIPARALALKASAGSTDFGEYFTYFSFFLVVAALMLAALFFRLGIEQRLREIGTLEAMGFTLARIRRIFLWEGVLISAAGSLLGMVGAIVYGAVILHGLRTWWLDAVGTRLLTLHIDGASLGYGALGGVAAAAISIAFTLRGLRRLSARNLLAGSRDMSEAKRTGRRALWSGIVCALAALGLLAASAAGAIGQVAGFFGAGTLLLIAALCFEWIWLARSGARLLGGVSGLGFRNAAHRPGRSMLAIALIASATFVVVAVGAFRKQGTDIAGTGGYPLMATSLLPIVHDANSDSGKQALNLSEAEISRLRKVRFVQFRLRPGEDASCLNLYEPQTPRILGVPDDFLRARRFAFAESLARTPGQKANPWLLLTGTFPDGAIPAIADANSIAYVLHKKLGEDLTVAGKRLRLVGALEDSIFQGEVLISARDFVRAFPEQEGYRSFLIDAPPEETAAVTILLEQSLADYGFDVVDARERLAGFHRVENTYLATFQSLGGLGLLLGTIGMSAVLLRNVLERRRELALLRAVGYRPRHLTQMVIAENLLLLAAGLLTGALCAFPAVAPALVSRGGHFPALSLAALLAAVLLTGLLASIGAAVAALRSPLLSALRTE